MRLIGFSTGAIALNDVDRALTLLEGTKSTAIELSALREAELEPLIHRLSELKPRLVRYKYISFHAPSALRRSDEARVVGLLSAVANLGWPIVVHPDVMTTYSLWRPLGRGLCIENMDKRKPIGQTCEDLRRIFQSLPDAQFCLDLGHARQVDATMSEAVQLLRSFQGRLCQLHVSDVNSSSHHDPLSHEAIMAFRKVSHLIPERIPVILESRVAQGSINSEISSALRTLAVSSLHLATA